MPKLVNTILPITAPVALLLTVKTALDPIDVTAFTCNRSPFPKHLASMISTESAPSIVVIVVVVVVVVVVVAILIFFIVVVTVGGGVVGIVVLVSGTSALPIFSIVEVVMSITGVVVLLVFSADDVVVLIASSVDAVGLMIDVVSVGIVEADVSLVSPELTLSLSEASQAGGCSNAAKNRLAAIIKMHFVFIFCP